jgi:hypothetical protein
LHHAPRIGEERPVRSDAAAIFIRRSDVVGANRDEPAIGDFETRDGVALALPLDGDLWGRSRRG